MKLQIKNGKPVKNKISSKTYAIATPAGCLRKWGGLDLEKQKILRFVY